MKRRTRRLRGRRIEHAAQAEIGPVEQRELFPDFFRRLGLERKPDGGVERPGERPFACPDRDAPRRNQRCVLLRKTPSTARAVNRPTARLYPSRGDRRSFVWFDARSRPEQPVQVEREADHIIRWRDPGVSRSLLTGSSPKKPAKAPRETVDAGKRAASVRRRFRKDEGLAEELLSVEDQRRGVGSPPGGNRWPRGRLDPAGSACVNTIEEPTRSAILQCPVRSSRSTVARACRCSARTSTRSVWNNSPGKSEAVTSASHSRLPIPPPAQGSRSTQLWSSRSWSHTWRCVSSTAR